MDFKVFTVVGARPQFIKAAAISRAIAEYNRHHSDVIDVRIIHTGQHYDHEMSQVFFDELRLQHPWKNLGVGSASHAKQTAAMMSGLEDVLIDERPEMILVFGDTNSTLAAALVAAKLDVPIAHVEAGLRSFNRAMPEEINRLVADHLSTLLFCPSKVAADNLRREGIEKGVHIVGDVMYDVLLFSRQRADHATKIVHELRLTPTEYLVATLHRAETTDDRSRLNEVLRGLGALEYPVVLPLHPRALKQIRLFELELPANVRNIGPVSYLEIVSLVSHCRYVVTDSGGLQKEAYWLGKPCVTIRNETEWVELVATGWNILTGADAKQIENAGRHFASWQPDHQFPDELYGRGDSAVKIVDMIMQLPTQQ